MTKFVYSFGQNSTDGNAEMRDLLGGKGANLAEMSSIGIPVPPGFTITTDVCSYYNDNSNNFPKELEKQVWEAIASIEEQIGSKFGDPENPLLVSVRSGARASMPGMMDTVLNLGLNDKTVSGLASQSGDERFAYDSYRRFIQMYGDVVLGVEHYNFEEILADHKQGKGVSMDTELTVSDLKQIVSAYSEIVEKHIGKPFPEDPTEQLWGAIAAVFGSWMNERAKVYRGLHNIPDDWGTAVNVQSMVFGNMGISSGTGVCFTRNPSNGDNVFYGEFLINAQGEDVVAGIRTPQPLTNAEKNSSNNELPSLEEVMPKIFVELCEVRKSLENHYRDMQDIEFTIQRDKLWILQTRNGKRTARAALSIAVDLAESGLISKEEAINRIDPIALDQLLHPTLDPNAPRNVLGRGLPASPGAATGKVVFSSMEAEELATKGEKAILVRIETSPEDIGGMHASAGILTTRGGMTSHAAVVARGMGRPCVAGAAEISVDYQDKSFSASGQIVRKGDVITIDGARGEVILGAVETIQPEMTGEFGVFMDWVDNIRLMSVRTNAETPEDVRTALRFGAEGIGLCRTEHMFFEPSRIISMREMILAIDEKGRRAALDKLLPLQKQDFQEIFDLMGELPVTIRLLDPPLHEFLPTKEEEIKEVASAASADIGKVKDRVAALHETNPMLGLRGCRLGIMYPEIYSMQCEAIFEAVVYVQNQKKITIVPEIMIPLVSSSGEFRIMKDLVASVAELVSRRTGKELGYLIGTMIELPRAALEAGKIAEEADFFSFGTNDLTQTAYGLSRDDSGAFLGSYIEKGIFSKDPFVTIDVDGVGELIDFAVKRGRAIRKDLKLGICGEHGGDPNSVKFCKSIGLDYVSCSPYRIPIARLSAAQAELVKPKDLVD